jgi:hypothetical protein
VDTEDQLINRNVSHLLLVSDKVNTLVSITPKPVVPVDTAHKDQDGLLDKIEPDVTESKRIVTVSQDSMKVSGTVSDAPSDKEEPKTKPNVKALPHVTDHSNTLVSGILKAVVHADSAHKDQDTLSEPIEPDVTDLERLVTASPDSMKVSWIV